MHGKQFITKNPLQENSKRSDSKLNMLTKNNLLLTFGIVFVLLFSIVEQASSSIVTFGYGGALTQVGGPNGLAVGDHFTGTFSYTPAQVGAPESGGGTRYAFDTFSLTILGQTASSTGGTILVYNQPPTLGDRFHLNADPTTTGAIVTGSINGAPASQLYLALVNVDGGSPFLNESLPTSLNLAGFPDLKRVDLLFQEGSGAVIGEITNVSVVPLPGTVWLFISGVGGLAYLRVRSKAA
jgi:hypothetical protein